MKYKNTKIVIYVIILLSLMKIDFRLEELMTGFTSDDHEYYYHLLTLAKDFDLDYSNQFTNADTSEVYINKNGDPKPNHGIGSAIIALPIFFISYKFANLLDLNLSPPFEYFVYSITAIILLFTSIKILFYFFKKEKIEINKNLIVLYIFGSGIIYYAFGRFSMSPVYEFFSVATLFLLSSVLYEKKTIFILPIVQFIFLMIRFNNYHLFLIPVLYVLVFSKNYKKLFNSIYLFGFILGGLIFLVHTYVLYDIFTFNPAEIFTNTATNEQIRFQRLFKINFFINNLFMLFKSLFVVFFGHEFGLIFFSPILFLSLYLFYLLIKNINIYAFITYVFIFFIAFLPVFVYQSPAYSFGYRYLFSLIPINLILFSKLQPKPIFLIKKYLSIFSWFGLISVIFFQSSDFTVLSTTPILNSFGNLVQYSNPNIFIGTIKSLILIESYLKIFFTSFLGIIFIKIINLFTNPIILISNFTVLTLKEINLLQDLLSFSTIYVFITLLLFIFLSKNLLKKC